MNKTVNIPSIQKIMVNFQVENERAEMTQEVMGDMLDDAMAEDGFPKDLTRLALRTFAREDEKKREEGGADGSSGSADAADAIDGAKCVKCVC